MSTSLAWKVTTPAFASYSMPFECPLIAHRQDRTNTSRTATVECITDVGAIPNDDEIWLEIEHLGDASSPQGSFVNDGKANLLATAAAQTTSSATWGTLATTFDGFNTLVVLSNGNLTVTHNNLTTNAGALSTALRYAGKYYFEVAVQVSTSSSNYAGIMSSSFAGVYGTPIMGTDSTSILMGTSSKIFSNGADTGVNLGTTAVGDVYCFAIDLTARLAWIRRNNGNWNNDGTANPATGVGGVTILAALSFSPIVRFAGTAAATDALTANFGVSAYAFTPPSGFGNWADSWSVGKFKLSCAFTPQQQSWIYGRVKCARPLMTFYIDPKITLS
jgi:hypothetical protein